MLVGTYGTVKGVLPRSLDEMGAQIIPQHLPSLARAGAGGTEEVRQTALFEGWAKPVLTDSGGFQVWSLGKMRKISEEGVKFALHVNCGKLLLMPEVSMQI